MRPWAHDLTFDQCEAWRAALKVEWHDLLKRAGVKSHKDLLKSRWLKGEAPKDRAKVRAALEALETVKREKTEIGAAILSLEEWHRIGETLVQKPAVFLEQLQRMRDLAQRVAKVVEAERVIAEAAPVLGSAFHEPTKPRK